MTCICIELSFHQYYKSNFHPQKRFMEISSNTRIDLKDWVEIDNDDHAIKKRIKRGRQVLRQRPPDSDRFRDPNPFRLSDGKGERIKEEDFQWLGYQWYLKNNNA